MTDRTLAALIALAMALPAFVSCTARGESDDAPSSGPDYSYVDDPSYRAPRGVLTATPAADPLENRTTRILIDNIRHTPPGARIKIVARSFSLGPVADALMEAHRRGVRVQIVADGRTSHRYQHMGEMREELGQNRSKRSFVHLTDGSARGGRTELHQKSWSFSRTGSSRRVVMVGSMNLSYYSTRQYTDVVSFVGRRDVWRAFSQVFSEQKADRRLRDPRRYYRLGEDEAWFFPGYGLGDDPVVDIIDEIPASPDTKIRVVMYSWWGDRGRAIAEAVAAKARGGADVEIIHGNAFGYLIEEILGDAGVVMHDGNIREREEALGGEGDNIHNKLMVVSHPDGAGGVHRFATTGSDNWADGGFERDEVIVRVDLDEGPGYRRYQRHFERIRARAVERAG